MVSIKSRRNLTRILNRITLSNYYNEHLKYSLLPRRSKVRFASAFFVKESHPPVSVLLLSRKKSCSAHLTDVANNFLRLCIFNAEYLIVLLSHIGTSFVCSAFFAHMPLREKRHAHFGHALVNARITPWLAATFLRCGAAARGR